MRDILDKLQYITESKGLANRKPGAVFKNSAGDQITFVDLSFFPEGGGRLEPEQLDDAVQQITGQLGDVQWQNTKTGRVGGFAIAQFDSETGPLYFGFFLGEVKSNPVDNNIKNQVGDYRFAGAAAAKTQAKMTPQDLLVNKTNLTVKDIMLQLSESLGTESPLYYVAHQVAMNAGFPIEVTASESLSFTGFRDYFCEILQPIALQNGNYKGNAAEAAQIFFGEPSFKNTTISFDSAKNAGLSDSVLELPDGRYVKVSSKGEKGAEASVKNLLDEVENVQNPELLEKYSDVIDLISTIRESGQAGAPLSLGVRYKIIDESDAEFIKSLRKFKPIPLNSIKDVTVSGVKPSKNIINLALSRNTKNPNSVALYYHLMAAVAHKVADKINDSTNFSQAASEILNNGALVQMYTNAKQSGNKWILEGFKTVYPSKAVTGVVISAGKNYSSTDIKGNFTFKILRNGAKADPDPTETEQATDSTADVDLVKAAEKITSPTKSVLATKKKLDLEPEPDLGRVKRKK
jgi:hypothetical protein